MYAPLQSNNRLPKVTSVGMTAISLAQPSEQTCPNIQRAADTVIVQYGGKEYALVADYNFAFNDPHWGNADMLGKQIGGKIGVIEDPFGKNGEPTYLGATTPIVGGAVDHLSLSANGKQLYADVLVDEQTGPGVWRVYKPLFVWDAAALVQAAVTAYTNKQSLTLPIDRIKGITGAAGQIAAATLQRYNGARAGEYFGWTYGIGTYSVPGRTQQLTGAASMEKPTAPPAPSIDENLLTNYYGISDAAMQKRIANGETSWLDAAAYAAKYTVYTAANFMVNGAIDRSAHLTENYVNGKLTQTQYALSMTSTVGYGLTAMVAAGRVATGVSKAVGMGIWGEAAGAVAGDAAYTFIQKGGDVVTYQLSDGQAGKSLQTITGDWTQVTTDMALGAGLGMLPGLLGRVPYLNGKIMWNSPSVGSSLLFRLVQPVMATDARGYRFTLADSTGGDILAAAGGRITRGAHTLDIPPKGMSTFAESELFLDDASKVLRGLLDDKASLREQAFQAAQISNSLVMAARNGLQDANLAARLNFTLPPSTFKQMEQKYAKDFSGDAMYRKIIADAEDQLHRLSCFVAGTLVHTQEGLRPIEQIKVGDYVLSKSESGEGEVSYKRVVKTFEREGQEVWFVGYSVLDGSKKEEFVVATADHPFHVKRTINCSQEIYEESVWVKTYDLYCRQERGDTTIFELADGREAKCGLVGPIIALKSPARGVVFTSLGVGDGNDDWGVDFSKDTPAYLGWELRYGSTLPISTFPDMPSDLLYGDLAPDAVTSVTCGHTPLLNTVYNLEVEDTHTYYVGELGVLVHNTCQQKLEEAFKDLPAVFKVNPKVNPAEPIGIFPSGDKFGDKINAAEGIAKDRGLGAAPDISIDGGGGQWQSQLDGAVFDGVKTDATTKRLMAYVLGYTNSVNRTANTVGNAVGTTGKNYISIGDGLIHVTDKSGNRVPTSIFADTKDWIFGNASGAMQKYVDGVALNDLSSYEKAAINSLVGALQKRSLALEQYNDLGLVYVPKKASNYIGQNGNTVTGGIELFTKFLNAVVKDTNFQNVPNGMLPVPNGVKWTFDDWFSSKIMIADHKAISSDGKLNTVADKITVFEKTYSNILDANGAVIGKSVSGIVAKEVDARTILIPADQTAQANAIETLKQQLTELGKSNLLVNEVGSNLGNNTLTQADLAQLLPAARQYWLDAGASAAVLDTTQITIGNLPAGVAGQSQGNQITLSADGAGWGWFVDATPPWRKNSPCKAPPLGKPAQPTSRLANWICSVC